MAPVLNAEREASPRALLCAPVYQQGKELPHVVLLNLIDQFLHCEQVAMVGLQEEVLERTWRAT